MRRQTPDLIEYPAQRVADVPEKSGLYAWYYRPVEGASRSGFSALPALLGGDTTITTEVRQRYGMKLVSAAPARLFLGADREQSASQAVDDAVDAAGPFLEWFFKSGHFSRFCRPIYIGIARDLHERVYRQHYESLLKYWDDESSISQYMSVHPNAAVQDVMNRLDLPHSFALEARVRGISPRDLSVAVLVTDTMPSSVGPDDGFASESGARRSLERFLQLLSDPICGRR